MDTKEQTIVDNVLDDLHNFIYEIKYNIIGNWERFDDAEDSEIEEYKKEDIILKDLAGSLQNVYDKFKRV